MKRAIAYEGMRTPWGKAQTAREIFPGMYFVSTSGHGGVKLGIKMNKLVPDFMRNDGGWYEEDIDWCIPYVALNIETEFLNNPKFNDDVAKAIEVFRNWKPAMYERYLGITLNPGESMKKDESIWLETNADKFQVLAAWGSGQTVRTKLVTLESMKETSDYKVPANFVVVIAAIGGRTNHIDHDKKEEAYFLVPDAEYQSRGRFGFIVDPARHEKVS